MLGLTVSLAAPSLRPGRAYPPIYSPIPPAYRIYFTLNIAIINRTVGGQPFTPRKPEPFSLPRLLVEWKVVMSKKKPKLIPAVGYLRKSTVDELDTKGKQKRQSEKSVSQQKKEIERLATGLYTIVEWYEDPNTSGWKRGSKRPGFQAIMDRAKEQGDIEAVLVDNIDRFSRASADDVQEDALKLKKAGVRYIVTAAQGTYDLGRRNDIGELLKFTVAVWSAHEFSRQLSRRVSIARRNRAAEGKRSGGPDPYGMKSDDAGGLLHGDPAEVKTIRWIFKQFADHRSMNWIAGELNAKKTPSPQGKEWFSSTVKSILKRKCYRGDFAFNEESSSQFFRIDGEGEVVEATEANGKDGKVFVTKGRYKPIIGPALFDKVQKRLAVVRQDRSQRKRTGYALTGVLICGHCNSAMYGCEKKKKNRKRNATIYRCNTVAQKGPDACKNYQVREDEILPLILKLLGQEITDIKAMLSAPPKELVEPRKAQAKHRKQTEKERDKLVKRIEAGEDLILDTPDKRNRQSLDKKLTAMRDELEKLEAELTTDDQPDTMIVDGQKVTRYSRDELAALTKWWDDFDKRACSVPVTGKVAAAAHLHQDPASEEAAILIDSRKVNIALLELGCEVKLKWKTVETISKAGNTWKRHLLVKGRFRLGQKEGSLFRGKRLAVY